MSQRNRSFVFDISLELEDGLQAYTASHAGQVGGTAEVIFLGGGPASTAGGPADLAMFEAYWVVDVSAIDLGSSDGLYQIDLQLSANAAFTSSTFLAATLFVGHHSASGMRDTSSSVVGRYVQLVTNTKPEGTIYPYARTYATIAGTLTTGITYRSFLAPKALG